MAPRLQYFLVFSRDPSAVDIVREDLVKGMQPENIAAGSSSGPDGVRVTFPWIDKDKVVHQVEGVILEKGLKKNLELIKVSREGQIIMDGVGIGTRKQEIQKELSRQANARKLELLQRSEDMLDGGPDALVAQLHPVMRTRRRGPLPPLSQERKEELKQKIDNMKCFKEGPNKAEVHKGTGIWVPAGARSIALGRYKNKPSRLISVLLHLAFPDDLLCEEGIAVTSSRQCVGLPSRILDSIYLCAEKNFRKAGGDIATEGIDIQQMLRDLITNTRQKLKRDSTTSTSTTTITTTTSTITTTTSTITTTATTITTTTDTPTTNTPTSTSTPCTTPLTITNITTPISQHITTENTPPRLPQIHPQYFSPDHGYAMTGPNAVPVSPTTLLDLSEYAAEEMKLQFNQL